MARRQTEIEVEVSELPPLPVRKAAVTTTFVMGDGRPRTETLEEDLTVLYDAMGRFVASSRRMKSYEVDVTFYDGFESS